MTSGGMPKLSEVLDRIGLASYLDLLTNHGFVDWETVLDITEDDLSSLGFKLGHRRALQREIATFRGIPPTESLESIEHCSPSPAAVDVLSVSTASPPPREKRRYRRHPRPDPNAPKKPKTAYVNFADQLRTHPEIGSLSFVDIAKEVGRRWQVLPAEQKRVWESQAARAMQEFEVQMDDYKKTESWRKYQVYLAEFKAQQAQATKSKRASGSRIDSFVRGESSRASPASSDSPTSLPSSSSGATDAELRHNALTLALSELVGLRGEVLAHGVLPYDEQHLPPEHLLRRAMHAFVQGTGSLLYTWTHGQVDGILDRIYRPNVQLDAITLAECFIVAAMGAHYDMECFPDHIRRLLYASGSLQFDEKSADINLFRTMRLLLSMSFYALLEKHMSARYLVAAGLQIARSSYPLMRGADQDVALESWQKIFRSLVFMDCWLSYTLGYMSEVKSEDIALACTSCPVDTTTVDDIIHSQSSKIGIIAAEISNTLASPERATRENIAKLAQKLEAWRAGVPEPLQFDTLTSGNPPNFTEFQRRAILMVHILYLGAVILLYRQQVVTTTERHLRDGGEWPMDLSMVDANKYRDECGVAGQQVARILRGLTFDGTLTTRCWLLIYWAFTACVVLLFSAATRLLDGHFDSVDADLTYAKSCMDVLVPCRASEPIAKRYLDLLAPLYDSLRDTHHRTVSRAKTSIYMLIQADSTQQSPPVPISKQEVGPTLERLCKLLMDPFGRRQAAPTEWGGRRVLNSDGSYSVYWWR